MQKTIRKQVYDTDTAELLGKAASGQFGDSDGYEERLYRTPDGYCFLYGVGGEDSPYPNEKIAACSRARAEEWLTAHQEL